MKRLWIVVAMLYTIISSAQAQPTIITLVVPEFFEDQYQETIIPAFEAQNPDVQVHLVTSGGFGADANPADDIEDYLDDLLAYATSADVLAVDTNTFTPEATRSGYFLDLSPLIRSDNLLNSADFYYAAWESFQWDGGHWALPSGIDVLILNYDPAAFDAAGLAYPNERWTLDDFANAVRRLAQFDANGNMTSAGFISFVGGTEALFISALGRGVYDETVIPSEPDFSGTDLEAVLQTWLDLRNDGMLGVPVEGDLTQAPMVLTRSTLGNLTLGVGEQSTMAGALLPGGRSVAVANGYAISSGTRYPDAAYRLARFLTESPEVASLNFGSRPARISLEGVQTGVGRFRFGGANTSPEMDALIDQALQVAFPASQLRFAIYLNDAVNRAADQGIGLREALDTVQSEILERLLSADARRDTLPIVVNTPPELVELAPGEISLNFGVASFITPLPNQDAWESFLTEFSARDAEVGRVVFDATFPRSADEMAARYDCFYLPSNAVPDADLATLRSLDPLMSSDTSFVPSNFVTNVFSQLQRNDQTWAMPISLSPEALRYDPAMFEQAGAFMPENWTVSDFELVLRTLKSITGDEPPFVSRGFGNSYLLNLIAAYGGVPFDYSQSPPQPNFTDPTTIEAIRQVLDLAREGLISYTPLANATRTFFVIGGEAEVPIYTETLNGLGFGGGRGRFDNDGNVSENTDPLVPYPRGTQYTAVSYDIGAAYISATTNYTDACYRLISAMTQSPDLVEGMPANRTLIDAVAATQGENAAAFYRQMDTILQQPDTVVFPSQGQLGAGSSLVDTIWLNRVFDTYVLKDGTDLEAELEQAELFTVAFQECVAGIPEFDPLVDDPRSYFGLYLDCAVQIDPSVVELLPR